VQISGYRRRSSFPRGVALSALLALCFSCTAKLNSGAPAHKGAGADTSPLVPPGSVSPDSSGVPTVPGPGVGPSPGVGPNGLPLGPATTTERRFATATGSTPAQAWADFRLEEAKRLLTQTTLSRSTPPNSVVMATASDSPLASRRRPARRRASSGS